MFIDRLIEFFEHADAPREADSERDGLLSYAAEWHALEIGLFVGMSGQWELITALAGFAVGGSAINAQLRDVQHVRDAGREPGYAAAGVVIGLGIYTIAVGVPSWMGTFP